MLKYLFVFSSAFIYIFVSVLSYLLLALHHISVFLQTQYITNLAVIPTLSSTPHKIHNGRFCPSCFQGHQVRP